MSILDYVLNALFPRNGYSKTDKSYLEVNSFNNLNCSKFSENLIYCSEINQTSNKDNPKDINFQIYQLIKRAKIGGEWDISNDLAKVLNFVLQKYINFEEIAFICAVPYDKVRFRNKLYHLPHKIIKSWNKQNQNQHSEIDLLTKIKHTKSQTSLSKSQRQTSILNVFKAKDNEPINKELIKSFKENKKIVLLLDDVITTGSTINECEKTIIQKLVSLGINDYKIIKIGIFHQV